MSRQTRRRRLTSRVKPTSCGRSSTAMATPHSVVRTPDGAYLCGDNTNSLILDPTVEISEPVTGTYDVWVGSTVATDLIPGFLVFTTRGDMKTPPS